jgi:hypothetical protein
MWPEVRADLGFCHEPLMTWSEVEGRRETAAGDDSVENQPQQQEENNERTADSRYGDRETCDSSPAAQADGVGSGSLVVHK